MFTYVVDLQLIKSSRLEKGYSLQEMADLTGIKDKVKYFRRESGEIKFKPEEIPAISNVLNIPYSKIFIRKVSKIETC